MVKQAALGSAFYAGSKDISGDIGALTSMSLSQNVQEVSGIDVSGTERLGLRRDGSMGWAGFWNASSGQIVETLGDLQGESIYTFVGPGSQIGRYAASLTALKSNFETAIGEDGSAGTSGEVMASGGVALEWGQLLTTGKETFAATMLVASWAAVTNYALNALVQPTTPNGHYYKVTTDAGSSGAVEPTWPTNGTTVVDDGITWTDQGLLPNGLDRGASSASNFGLAAYLHVFSIGSGTANVKLQDSADRIAWDDIGSAAFAAVTTAGVQRIETGPTENVRRYVRAYVAGTFTNLVAAINVVVYRTA